MANEVAPIGVELANLDFASLIGGPLKAAIQAQAQSAMTSVDFIKSVGFNGNSLQTVDFQYLKAVGGGTPVSHTLTVPILTMLPIPFIRIDELTIDFNAKITSTVESSVVSSSDLSTQLNVNSKFLKVAADLKVNYAYKRTTSSGFKEERTYTMAVHVRAVQDEMPAGTARLLAILENAISEKDNTKSAT